MVGRGDRAALAVWGGRAVRWRGRATKRAASLLSPISRSAGLSAAHNSATWRGKHPAPRSCPASSSRSMLSSLTTISAPACPWAACCCGRPTAASSARRDGGDGTRGGEHWAHGTVACASRSKRWRARFDRSRSSSASVEAMPGTSFNPWSPMAAAEPAAASTLASGPRVNEEANDASSSPSPAACCSCASAARVGEHVGVLV